MQKKTKRTGARPLSWALWLGRMLGLERANARSSGKRVAGLGIACAMAVVLFGCLQTDPTGPKGNGDVTPDIEDNSLRAGATSTTNWPPRTAGREVWVFCKADSVLNISFVIVPANATDTLAGPVPLTGDLTLFPSGSIPALHTVDSVSMPFENADTVTLMHHYADSLSLTNQDSLLFNLRVRTDSGEVYILHLGYLPRTRMFFQTDISEKSEEMSSLKPSNGYYREEIDTAFGLVEAIISGQSEVCFYIPGTSVFQRVRDDSLSLGPIGYGDYPLRVMRVTASGPNGDSTKVEIFEAVQVSQNPMDVNPKLRQGDLISTQEFKGKVSLRFAPQP